MVIRVEPRCELSAHDVSHVSTLARYSVPQLGDVDESFYVESFAEGCLFIYCRHKVDGGVRLDEAKELEENCNTGRRC